MIHEYRGTNGVARQGDVLIYKLPKEVTINRTQEILPKNGKLVLLEGEMTGHHHAINVMDRPEPRVAFGEMPVKPVKTSKAVEDIFAKAMDVGPATAKMYNDKTTCEQLMKLGVLTRSDLYIGTLEIVGGGDVGMIVTHDEHDGIRLLAGTYYIGRQVESAGAEERRVSD